MDSVSYGTHSMWRTKATQIYRRTGNLRAVRRRFHSPKAHLSQIESTDTHFDHADGVALVNEIIEAFGQ